MPPKAARGRGGTRGGRGGARGGASSSQPAQSADTPQETSTAGAVESAVVPKQEDGAHTNIATTIEPGAASYGSTSTSTVAETAARAPRQRLDSLKSAESSSRSASPSVRRGTSTRGRKAPALPTFTGRRSKEERDARTAATMAREEERNKYRDAEAARKQKQKEKAELRARNSAARGRGGYSGAVSGPFSMASARDKKASRNFAGYGTGGSGGGGGSGSRATRVKDEYDGAGSSGRSGGSGVKREDGDDGGDVSSDDDQDAGVPRKDIDLIEISSDEDEAPSARQRTQLPVRIGRKEHKERIMGINTDASTESSGKLLQEAEATGDSAPAEGVEGASRKGKGKAKDFEITGERKPFKGMWQEPEDAEAKVKSEPVSDDENMAMDAEQVGIGADAETQEMQPGAERKLKLREHKEPNLQTEEERAEWARFQANLRHVREELGPEDEPIADSSGDVKMDDSNKPNRRDNHAYLFQLPPIIPELLESKVKKEQSDPQSKAPDAVQPAQNPPVKQEEGEFSSTLPKEAEGPRIASGRVGKLRVHQSGRTTLDWGGVDYELTPGKPASFLQEVVSLRIREEKERVVAEMAGEAVSLGRVKGKFVVTPDFSTIFG
ncbi:hypothetical protein P280DRAFT_464367 [Massarina eburnea CBS 473.64]|uniref:RNA polymerase III RPC4-domain-containing protein n=1 Tax=Massarina eburnea CBS 473.64 TaxID=1395130 RepID=A0A6A6SIR0_9PLEO|nr:hypothetical protein P280DRAFT_464367 [Massarina eburnea CBS 473.64]